MTKFNCFDHDDALRACLDATNFGAAVSDDDIVTLNRAAGAFACNAPETLTRRDFSDALARVRAAIERARS